jgi:hypothetical protein
MASSIKWSRMSRCTGWLRGDLQRRACCARLSSQSDYVFYEQGKGKFDFKPAAESHPPPGSRVLAPKMRHRRCGGLECRLTTRWSRTRGQ